MKILSVIPYPFYPPMSGGALRCFYLLREIARFHEVFLFTVQPVEDLHNPAGPEFPRNVSIISDPEAKPYRSVFNMLPGKWADAINYRLLKKKLFTTTNSYFLKTYPLFMEKLEEIRPDIVFFENLEVTGLLSEHVKKKLPSAKQVYDAHNIDSELWKQLAAVQNNPLLNSYASRALKTERNLYRSIDAVFCCSNDDREKLLQLNRQRLQIIVIPNGVDCELKRFDINPAKNNLPEILFCGSLNYEPNREGLNWFYDHVFPLIKINIPRIKLTIIGNGENEKDYKQMGSDPFVNFIGSVPDVVPYYNKCAVSIVPLLHGSGTRLKILEAMSLGTPVISTSAGAEGINYENGKHLLIADKPEVFAERVKELLEDTVSYNKMRKEALDLVKQYYDWEKIGITIEQSISDLNQKK